MSGPLPPVTRVTRWDHHFSWGTANNVMFRWYLQYAGALSQADLNTWVASAIPKYSGAGHILPGLCSDLLFNRLVVTDLTTASSPQTIATPGVGGTVATPSVSQGVSMVIGFKIARRYRGGKPRIYLPAIPLSARDTPGTWIAGLPAAYASDIGTTIADIGGVAPGALGAITHVNVSYFEGFVNVTFPSGRTRPVPKLRITPPVVDVVTGYVGNTRTASQRRRNEQSA